MLYLLQGHRAPEGQLVGDLYILKFYAAFRRHTWEYCYRPISHCIPSNVLLDHPNIFIRQAIGHTFGEVLVRASVRVTGSSGKIRFRIGASTCN
jgi:hypothetical protein